MTSSFSSFRWYKTPVAVMAILLVGAGRVGATEATTPPLTAPAAAAAPVPVVAIPGLAATAAEATPLAVGTRAPGASIVSMEGKPLELADLLAGKPTVMIFYRGGWCPYCNTQLAELAVAHDKFVALGYQVLALSTDAPGSLPATVEKDKVNYTLLSDRNMAAARAYQVAWRVPAENAARYAKRNIELAPVPGVEGAFWLPVPAVFLIDAQGMIRAVFANPDFKVRPPVDQLLTQAQAMVAK